MGRREKGRPLGTRVRRRFPAPGGAPLIIKACVPHPGAAQVPSYLFLTKDMTAQSLSTRMQREPGSSKMGFYDVVIVKANISAGACSVHRTVLLQASRRQPPVLPCSQHQPQKAPFAPMGLGWTHHHNHADMPLKARQQDPPMLADFGSSQWCERWRASTVTGQTLSQPGFDKSLPVTRNLPRNTLGGFAKSGTQIYREDGPFHLLIYSSAPPSPLLRPNSPGL